MLGIRSIVTAAFVAAAVFASNSVAVFGEHYGVASEYNPRSVAQYDYPYFGDDDDPVDDYGFGSYEPDYGLFDDDAGYQFPSHRGKFAGWFVPETYEPAVQQDSYGAPLRSPGSLDFELGTRCECSNAGYLVP